MVTLQRIRSVWFAHFIIEAFLLYLSARNRQKKSRWILQSKRSCLSCIRSPTGDIDIRYGVGAGCLLRERRLAMPQLKYTVEDCPTLLSFFITVLFGTIVLLTYFRKYGFRKKFPLAHRHKSYIPRSRYLYYFFVHPGSHFECNLLRKLNDTAGKVS